MLLKKRLCCYGVLLSLIVGLASCTGNNEKRSHTLKIYNWADYMDESLIPEFEQWYREQTGEEVHVVMQFFDINEMALAKIEKGHEDFDLVCPSDFIIERMARKGLLLPLDTVFGKTPNYIPNVSPYITHSLNTLSPEGMRLSDYTVGYMWGTLGILYNTRHVTPEEVSSWNVLWNPKFRKRLFVKDAIRDVYSIMMIKHYQDSILTGRISVTDAMNDASDHAIGEAEKLLKAMKGNVAGWETDFGKEMMTREAAYMNVNWSGDAVWAIEEAAAVGVPLDYSIPMEGSNVWFDGWVIPKYAKNPKAANYFINFMCRPESAIRNMDEIGYVSAVATPEVLESRIDTSLEETVNLAYFFGPGAEEVAVDPIQYPDQAVIDRCAVMHDFEAKTPDLVAMWSRVKGDSLHIGWKLLIAGTMIAIIAYNVVQQARKRRHLRRIRSRR